MESMEIDSSTESVLRPNSIWLRGVDNLSTADIKNYIKEYVEPSFKLEWINDTSLNIVFETDDEAKNALDKLSLQNDLNLQPNEEREAQKFKLDKPDTLLTIRISNLSDKKVKNAAAYSRYYLYNPPKYELDKDRRKSKRRNDYREREPVHFRRSRDEDEDKDDGLDLFPEKAPTPSASKRDNEEKSDSIRNESGDVDLLSSDQTSNNETLSSRIGLKNETSVNNSNSMPSTPSKSGNLLDRIGSKFKEKNLEKDDLFN